MTPALVHPLEGWGTCGQWALAFFAVVLSWAATAAFTRLDRDLRAGAGEGIVAFELAGSVDRMTKILRAWANEDRRGMRAARAALLVDLPFLAAYGFGLALVAAVVAESARGHQWTGTADVAALVAGAFLIAAAADLFENVALGVVLTNGWREPEQAAEPWPRIAQVLAILKFSLLALGVWVIVIIATVGVVALLGDAWIQLGNG